MNNLQKKAVDLAMAGHNLFITGQAGTGKTFVLKEMISVLRQSGRKVAVLCTTGMASLNFLNFGATTVHRWAGLYDGRYHSSELKDLVLRDDRYDHVRKNACDADVIIIDEVSMLSKKIFEQLELVCRTAMGNHQLFGGTQIISCGDFRQLRPVKNDLYNDPGLYCFQSDIWTSVFPHRCHLVDVMRQDEQELIIAIDETARGAVSDETHNLLKSLDRPLLTDVQPLHLCAHNADAQWYNSEKLGDPEKVYHANVSGTHKYLKRIIAPNYLAIKIGCPVILLINLSSTLVNGLHDIVKSYDDNSIGVHFPDIKETYSQET
ncbi:hypothetical protein ScPMuIL_006467 [Solemya velum]